MLFRRCNAPLFSASIRAGRSATWRTIGFYPPGCWRPPSGIGREPDGPGPLRISLRWPMETCANVGTVLLIDLETELLPIECIGPCHVRDPIANAPGPDDKAVRLGGGILT